MAYITTDTSDAPLLVRTIAIPPAEPTGAGAPAPTTGQLWPR